MFANINNHEYSCWMLCSLSLLFLKFLRVSQFKSLIVVSKHGELNNWKTKQLVNTWEAKQQSKREKTFWIKSRCPTYLVISTLSSIGHHPYFLTCVFRVKCFTCQEGYYTSFPGQIIRPTFTEQFSAHGIAKKNTRIYCSIQVTVYTISYMMTNI